MDWGNPAAPPREMRPLLLIAALLCLTSGVDATFCAGDRLYGQAVTDGCTSIGGNLVLASIQTAQLPSALELTSVAGDVVVWVGMGRAAGSVPWADLGKRGVLRVQYQTEPFGDRCLFDSVWHGARDEIWDYSRHNVELCTSARNGGG